MDNPAQKPTANSGNVAYHNSGRRFLFILFIYSHFGYWTMLELVVVKSLLKYPIYPSVIFKNNNNNIVIIIIIIIIFHADALLERQFIFK